MSRVLMWVGVDVYMGRGLNMGMGMTEHGEGVNVYMGRG